MTIRNDDASFQQSGSYLPWFAGHPYCQLYAPAEDTIPVTYSAPGQDGTDSYGNGRINLQNHIINLADGQEHFVFLRWLNNTDQVLKYTKDVAGVYPHPGSNVPTNSRTRYTSGGDFAVDDQQLGQGGWYYINRNIETGLPVRMQMINNVLTLLDPYGAFARPDAGATQTAKMWDGYVDANSYLNYTGAVSKAFLKKFEGGSLLMQGRPKTSGEGHGFYIHRNVRVTIDNFHANEDGQMGQANEYMFRHGSDTGVPGQNDYISITNWSGTTAKYPWFTSSYALAPVIQLTNSNDYGYLTFTGTAQMGQSAASFGTSAWGVPFIILNGK